jgi:hypothetical protein
VGLLLALHHQQTQSAGLLSGLEQTGGASDERAEGCKQSSSEFA